MNYSRALKEIKEILKKFPRFGGVGFVVAPKIVKLAAELGLGGYDLALSYWLKNESLRDTCDEEELEKFTDPENTEFGFGVFWEGANLRFFNNKCSVGLKNTLEQIETLLTDKN